MKGHIKITDKVYFKPDGLPRPNKKVYDKAKLYNFERLIIQKYEASKKTVKVSNKINLIIKKESIWLWIREIAEYKFRWKKMKNSQSCKAEVTNNKALITKLL